MIRPVDDRSNRAAAGRGEMHQAQRRVEHLRVAGIGDQARRRQRNLEERHDSRRQRASSVSKRRGRGLHYLPPIVGIDAAAKLARSPDAHQVGRRMIVGGGDDDVVETRRRSHGASNRQHLVVEEPDGVERHHPEAMLAIVDHRRHGVEIVVNRSRRTTVTESGEPDGLREVGVDGPPTEADAQSRCRGRRRTKREREVGARVPIAQVPERPAAQQQEQRQERDRRSHEDPADTQRHVGALSRRAVQLGCLAGAFQSSRDNPWTMRVTTRFAASESVAIGAANNSRFSSTVRPFGGHASVVTER